ncbi:MAG TPA: hypothetical protein VE912_04785, partial [Bacteroidales bacterium]|nr:hypothetical protein [Bacteroidales bacterium]
MSLSTGVNPTLLRELASCQFIDQGHGVIPVLRAPAKPIWPGGSAMPPAGLCTRSASLSSMSCLRLWKRYWKRKTSEAG